MYLLNRICAAIILLLACGLPISAGPARSRRADTLAKGIADLKARIAVEDKLAAELDNAVLGHIEEMGEIVGRENKGPVGLVLKIKEACKDVGEAWKNGREGQLWPAVGQLGQAVLDCASDPVCAGTVMPPVAPYSEFIAPVDFAEESTFAGLRTLTTMSERNGYRVQAEKDRGILQNLEQKSAEIDARPGPERKDPSTDVTLPTADDTVLPITPPDANLSAWNDALLIARWFDLGNRAFKDKDEEDSFYKKFPGYQKFRMVAETHSPRTEITDFVARCAPTGPESSASGGVPAGAPPPNTSMAQQISGVGAYLRSVNKKPGCPETPPK